MKGTITWSIQEGSAGGQLFVNDVFDSSLNVRKMGYIAPNIPGTYHVIATSDDDPTQQAQATMTVAANAEIFKKTGNLTIDHQTGFSATTTCRRQGPDRRRRQRLLLRLLPLKSLTLLQERLRQLAA